MVQICIVASFKEKQFYVEILIFVLGYDCEHLWNKFRVMLPQNQCTNLSNYNKVIYAFVIATSSTHAWVKNSRVTLMTKTDLIHC